MTLVIDLSGKKALVTGAGRGIGRAIALALAEAGAAVCLTARTEAQLQETAAAVRARGGQALVVPAEATDGPAVARVVEQCVKGLGGLHLLLNNAGMELAKTLVDTTEADYDRVMAVNVKSMYLFSRAAGPHLIAQGGGAVVNTASVGAFVAAPGQAIYHASKAAVAHLTRALAIEWARHGIRVNAVAPGWVRTDLISYLTRDTARLERYTRAIPLRRLAEPEEIAPLVVFLCSDQASYLTGAVVPVDGGLLIP